MGNEVFITSIGATYNAKNSFAQGLSAEYVSSPFDEMENTGQYQFLNVAEIMWNDFRQIQPDDLEYKESGYEYIGKKLLKPFSLPFFFQGTANAHEAWTRWKSRCRSFQELLMNKERKLLLISFRIENDMQEQRCRIAHNLDTIAYVLEDKYKRTPNDYRILSIIAAGDVTETAIEAEGLAYRQVVVPCRDCKPCQEYINIARQYLKEFNQCQPKDITP